jgi:hypothetical protein
MKEGDLVTLSASALNRDTLWQWKDKPPIGLIVQCKVAVIGWSPKGAKPCFKVEWCGSGPKSREGDWSWVATSNDTRGWYYRRDLKFVRLEKKDKDA